MNRPAVLALLLGLVVTAAVMAADGFGALDAWEWRSVDFRFRHVPRPSDRMTDEIAHVDIDDGSIENIARWPWDRMRLADVIDELRAAGAATIALDLILSDEQQYPLGTDPTIDHDERFAEALARVQCVLAVDIVATEELFDEVWRMREGAILLERLLDTLRADITLGPDDVGLAGVYLERFRLRQIQFKRAAAWRAVRTARPPFETFDEFERALVPLLDDLGTYPEQHVVRSVWDQSRAWEAARRHLLPRFATGSHNDKVPLGSFTDAADAIGFVSVRRQAHRDGFVRELEVLLPATGGAALQFGLAAAISHRGLTPADVKVSDDRIRLGDVELPLRDGRLWLDWPTSGNAELGWEALLQREDDAPGAGHVAIGAFASLAEMRRTHAANLGKRLLLAQDILQEEGELDFDEVSMWVDSYLLEPELLPATMHEACLTWRLLMAEIERGEQNIAELEQELRAKVGGKLVFIGWTGTGALADFVQTALDAKTPGVVVHAAMADMALTGRHVELVRRPVGLALTFLIGLLCTLPAARLAALPSALLAIAVLAVYVLLTGRMFSAHDLLVPLVAPVAAGSSSWVACTALQAAISQRERKRITRQFRARVSAQLVDYLVDNPDAVSMSGEERELTVVIGDLAGFTTISEKLGGPRTVATLNRYMSALTDVLIAQGAYMNKFLGDGLMAFWSAFAIDPEQADKACRAALECHRVVERLNDDPQFAEIPRLGLRVGVATGKVIVGDCGAPPDLNDYTVIGDAVNLAARLESANKQFGTRILINGRTRELVGDDSMLMRPIGRIRVVGQERKVDVFEVLSPGAPAALIELSERVVTSFVAGEFEECLRALEALEKHEGPSRLVDIYRNAIDVVDDGFDGALQLTEK